MKRDVWFLVFLWGVACTILLLHPPLIITTLTDPTFTAPGSCWIWEISGEAVYRVNLSLLAAELGAATTIAAAILGLVGWKVHQYDE